MTTKSAVGVNDSEYQNISVYKYVLTHECMQAFYTCMNNLHDLYEQIIPKDVNNEKLNICTLEVNKFLIHTGKMLSLKMKITRKVVYSILYLSILKRIY